MKNTTLPSLPVDRDEEIALESGKTVRKVQGFCFRSPSNRITPYACTPYSGVTSWHCFAQAALRRLASL